MDEYVKEVTLINADMINRIENGDFNADDAIKSLDRLIDTMKRMLEATVCKRNEFLKNEDVSAETRTLVCIIAEI